MYVAGGTGERNKLPPLLPKPNNHTQNIEALSIQNNCRRRVKYA